MKPRPRRRQLVHGLAVTKPAAGIAPLTSGAVVWPLIRPRTPTSAVRMAKAVKQIGRSPCQLAPPVPVPLSGHGRGPRPMPVRTLRAASGHAGPLVANAPGTAFRREMAQKRPPIAKARTLGLPRW